MCRTNDQALIGGLRLLAASPRDGLRAISRSADIWNRSRSLRPMDMLVRAYRSVPR